MYCPHINIKIIEIYPDIYESSLLWLFQVSNMECIDCGIKSRAIKHMEPSTGYESKWILVDEESCKHPNKTNVYNIRNEPVVKLNLRDMMSSEPSIQENSTNLKNKAGKVGEVGEMDCLICGKKFECFKKNKKRGKNSQKWTIIN